MLTVQSQLGSDSQMFEQTLKPDDFPEIPPVTRKLFLRFVNLANKTIPHPLDIKRFYQFIRFCHTRRVKLAEDELREYLLRAGFPERNAERLSNIYYHGRALLSVRVRT